MRWLLLTSVVFAGLATKAAADIVGPPAPANDVQDLVFLRGNRPVLLRLHVRVAGKPFTAIWDAYIDQLFAHLDVNGDGVLDQAEAGRAPRARTLVPNQQGRGFLGQYAAVDFKDLQPEDGQVTRAKLAAYYHRAGFPMFQVMTDTGAAAQAAALTDVLFKALDRDGDGKLSKEELQHAAASLRRFDVDDDETVTVQELAPIGGGFPLRQPQQRQAGNNAMIAVDPHDRAALAAKLLEAFDKNKDKKLTHEEIGLEEARFGQLDVNGDGELDADELARFDTLPPDGEFTLRVGALGAGEAMAEVTGAEKPELPAKKVGEALEIAAGLVRLTLRSNNGQGNDGAVGILRRFLLQQFKGLAGKKGYVEKNDLQANDRFFGPVFPLADRDGDGKLTEKELTGFLAIVDRANTAYVVLTVADRGRVLFDALDSRRDGRLRFHELRSAWDRLAGWDRDGKGFIAKTDMPARMELNLALGQPNQLGRVVAIQRVRPVEVPRAPTKGPLWFRKMDRNGDGVVSLREWLGGIEDFKRFDSNGDGVIDPDEADKADRVLRSPADKKP